jgi:hypothetical protein
MKYTYTFTHTEVGALTDALKKGAARHESYAKFYPGQREEQHKAMAVVMRHLLKKLDKPAD